MHRAVDSSDNCFRRGIFNSHKIIRFRNFLYRNIEKMSLGYLDFNILVYYFRFLRILTPRNKCVNKKRKRNASWEATSICQKYIKLFLPPHAPQKLSKISYVSGLGILLRISAELGNLNSLLISEALSRNLPGPSLVVKEPIHHSSLDRTLN